jgi:hypothetical protein
MLRAIVALSVAAEAIGCDERTTAADVTAAPRPATAANATVRTGGRRELPAFDCAEAIEVHLATRLHANRCKRDRDCGEIWPGLCPRGPYYVDRDADARDLFAEERNIARHCKLPSCEPPAELGIAHCEDGICIAGRPPANRPGQLCRDVRETHLEPIDEHEGATATEIRGDTARLVLVPIDSGTLRITVDWPRDCDDCRLNVWRDEQGVQPPAEPVRVEATTANGAAIRREHFELDVAQALPETVPGSPTNIVPTAAAEVPYRLRNELLDHTGHPGAVSRHGTSWDTRCEAVK